MKIGIIGLGLIGGSIAKGLKKKQDDIEIVAFDIDKHQLELALEDNNIDVYTVSIDDNFKDCDLIFLSTPINISIKVAKELSYIVNRDCIITDVSSTKEQIMKELEYLKDIIFIGGHPMSGSEKSGYLSSSDILFENAYYIITPYENTEIKNINLLKSIINDLGAICIELTPLEHDKSVAIISHMPHIIASCLVNFVKENDNHTEVLKTLCAGGFKDITRIASSDGDLWHSIIKSNKHFVLENLNMFSSEVTKVINIIENEDKQLIKYINDGKDYRDEFKDSNNFPKNYEISIDVPDKPNIIGLVTTMLGKNNINIKNIGINNNREEKIYALSIVFYEMKSMETAILLLQENGFKIKKM